MHPNDEIKFFKSILKEIPRIHFNTIIFVFTFFQKVISFESENKMTPNNIAICFTPVLFKFKFDGLGQKDIQKNIADTISLTVCLRKMIEKFEEIFDQPDLLQMSIESVINRKSIVINEMKKFDKMEDSIRSMSSTKNNFG